MTVIFDAAIRHQLKRNDQEIRDQFNKRLNVHTVASKQLADETILETASHNKNDYVVSNDRFGELFDKEIVKNKRLIKHEILKGRVMIHEIDVNLKY